MVPKFQCDAAPDYKVESDKSWIVKNLEGACKILKAKLLALRLANQARNKAAGTSTTGNVAPLANAVAPVTSPAPATTVEVASTNPPPAPATTIEVAPTNPPAHP